MSVRWPLKLGMTLLMVLVMLLLIFLVVMLLMLLVVLLVAKTRRVLLLIWALCPLRSFPYIRCVYFKGLTSYSSCCNWKSCCQNCWSELLRRFLFFRGAAVFLFCSRDFNMTNSEFARITRLRHHLPGTHIELRCIAATGALALP